MSDLVCLNTMERCPMPSMCRPFGGCSRSLTRAIAPPPAADAVVTDDMVRAYQAAWDNDLYLRIAAVNDPETEEEMYFEAIRKGIAAALAARGK